MLDPLLLERAWASLRDEWEISPYPPSLELFAEACRRDGYAHPDDVATSLLLGRWPVAEKPS